MSRLRTVVVAAVFLIAFGVTVLFRGMRGIMRLGGFVATGGPYVIAHPAPDWVWIVPVSLLAMLAAFFVHLFLTGVTKAIPMVLPFWSGLFLSLGYNFLEFTVSPPGEMAGFPWGWLVCGIVFVAMGGVPLLLAVRGASGIARQVREMRLPIGPLMPEGEGPPPRFFVAVQLAAVPLGIAAGVLVFGAVAG